MKKILYLVLVAVLAAAVPAWGQNNQTYTLGKIPAGWTVKANGNTVTVTDSTAIIPAGATVVLTPTNTAKVKKVTLKDAPACRRIDLGTLTADFVAQNCDTLTGETSSHKVTIAAGATVILDGVTISASKYCIKCAGDATIILEDGTTNTLTCTTWDNPALWVGDANTTLTIQGSTGKLNVKSDNYYAGIGGGKKNTNYTCGNIRIEGGIITAEGGLNAAGIGADYNASCGDITISGGTVTATGGSDAAGIGGSWGGSCGDITITSGITQVTATKGEGAPNSIGAGYGTGASCGTVTIDPSLSDVTVGDTRTISHAPSIPTGAINGKFTINTSGDQIYFSQGNLRYQASTGTWRFAEHQYDCILDAVGNTTAASDRATQSDWIDLFGWGTGNNPTTASLDNGEYNTFHEWGDNTISNGGNEANSGWRTMMDAEWTYLFANNRWGFARISGTSTIYGIVLEPGTSNTINTNHSSPGDNNYASVEAFETAAAANGLVFLPVTGQRTCGDNPQVNYTFYGYYWTSTDHSIESYSGWLYMGGYVTFNPSSAPTTTYSYAHMGQAVRLVKNAQ
jgi:hypothetical protein